MNDNSGRERTGENLLSFRTREIYAARRLFFCSYSPNLPLRFLFYISNLYSGMTRDDNLYGTKKAQIPTPEFIIFCNGEEERPERETLKLSDLYTLQEKGGKSEEEDYRLELKAELLNIGGDNNKALKNACRTLRE